jgi:hypothetical protein
MSSETALVVVIALLWGPTMLWLLFRLARGQSARHEFGIRDQPAQVQASTPASADLSALVHTHGFWLCESCKSLNRREAKKCYACRTARDRIASEPAAPAEAPALVPVMDATRYRALGPEHANALSTTASAATAATGAPPMSTGAGTVTGEPGHGIAALASGAAVAHSATAASSATGERPHGGAGDDRGTPASTPTIPAQGSFDHGPATVAASAGLAARESRDVAAAAPATPRAGLAVCPFVGLDSDPSTWFDFPDPDNVCHAIPADDGSVVGSVLRIVGARPSARLLDAETQESRCLTEAHRECSRYLAAMAVLAVPNAGGSSLSATPMATAAPVPRPSAPVPPAPARPDQPPATVVEPPGPRPASAAMWHAHAAATEPADGNGAHADTTPARAVEPAPTSPSTDPIAPSTDPAFPSSDPVRRASNGTSASAEAAASSAAPRPTRESANESPATLQAQDAATEDSSAPKSAVTPERSAEVNTTPGEGETALPAPDEASGSPNDTEAKPKSRSSSGAKPSPEAAAEPEAADDTAQPAPKRRKRTRTTTSSTTKRTPEEGSATKTRPATPSRSRGRRSSRS